MGFKQVGCGLVLTVALAGCERNGCVRLSEARPLLDQPSPIDYPSSNPRPNRLLALLPPGKYAYQARSLHHDFVVYQITRDTLRGYVVEDTSMVACTLPK